MDRIGDRRGKRLPQGRQALLIQRRHGGFPALPSPAASSPIPPSAATLAVRIGSVIGHVGIDEDRQSVFPGRDFLVRRNAATVFLYLVQLAQGLLVVELIPS